MTDTDSGVVRYPYLLDDKLAAEHKTMLLQADLERDKDARLLPKERETASLERLKFWNNTPLVVALVGVITIGANFFSSYFLSDQTGDIGAEQRKREFAYKIMETELGKIGPEATEERANALLFLTRIGVLDGLNLAALEAIAVPAGGNTTTVTIPQTLGLGTPNYDLAAPEPTAGQTAAANGLHQIAVAELNRNVGEATATERIAAYWSVLPEGQRPVAGDSGRWAGVFLAWLIREAGNPDGIELSGSNARIWHSASALGLTVDPAAVLPGDIAILATDAIGVETIRNGQQAAGNGCVVHAVRPEILDCITGNIGNGVRLVPLLRADYHLVGYFRIGSKTP